MTLPVLQIRDMVTRLDTVSGPLVAVNGISMTISQGECVGLVGESGCGKTMAAMSVAGLLPEGSVVQDGTIVLNGVDLSGLPEDELRRYRSSQIGVVFQNPLTALNPRMNIGAQMREALPEREHDANIRAAELLDMVGVPGAWDRLVDFPHELSGGLAQRVVIALALARNPKLLIADEPTTALDVSIQAQILDLIDGLRRDLGLGVLLVTHDMDVVAERAQKVAVMYAGNIVEEGTTEAILSQPVHPYTARLLASIPHKVPPGQALNPVEGAPPSLIKPPPGCRFAPRCSRATDICNSALPELTPADASHRFRCYHPLDKDSQLSTATEAIVTHLPGPGGSLVEVQNVSRTFTLSRNLITRRPIKTRAAVSEVTLDIKEGESLGIVGESGCGKSTLARLVAELDRPTGGRISYRGKPLGELGKDAQRWRREVQLIFQDPYSSLDPLMTVGEAVAEPLVYQGMASSERTAKVERLLEEVGLPAALIHQRPAQISGGQRQRVGIARALAQDPKLIIADESVSALDVSVQATILNLFRRLQRERGLTYLFISHDLNVVRYMCDRVVVMYLGRPVEISATETLFANPQHPYTKALLASIPGASETGGRLEGEIPSSDNPPPGCSFNPRCVHRRDRCVRERPRLEWLDDTSAAACFFPLGKTKINQEKPDARPDAIYQERTS